MKYIVPSHYHIGFPRTGTTWLQKGVFPQIKKAVFVPQSRVEAYYQATQKLDLVGLYNSYSSKEIGNRIILESEEVFSGGPYTDAIEMADKISWVNPNAKILICVRSQYSIMESLYYLYVKKGGTLDFSNYVETLIKNRKLDYWKLIQSYRSVFPVENVKILIFEDLVKTPEKFLASVLEWIGKDIKAELPISKYKNSRKSMRFIQIQRSINTLVGTTAVTREMSNEESEYYKDKLFLRTKFSKPFDKILQKYPQLNLSKNHFCIPESLKSKMSDVYAPGNENLFKDMNIPLQGSAYPGDEL